MKKFTVFTELDLDHFNVWDIYYESGLNFFVEVEETGMVYYPVFNLDSEGYATDFEGWK